MEKQLHSKKDIVLMREEFFDPQEHVHIQYSTEYPKYIEKEHRHNFIEFSFVVSGRAKHEIDGKIYDAKTGDLFVINLNMSHRFYDLSNENEPFIVHELMFDTTFFDNVTENSDASGALNRLYSIFLEKIQFMSHFNVAGVNQYMLWQLFRKIHCEYLGKNKGYTAKIQEYLLQIISIIFCMEEIGEKESEELYKNNVIDFVKQYIKSHYMDKISVRSLSELVHLNSDYLGRIFKKQTGITISYAIQKKRVEAACRLLLETNTPVTLIAEACGFDDVSFFYSVFKKHMGVLPNLYRKSEKE